MDAVTIFVAHEPKTFDGQNGAWTLHKFKDQNGTYFQTTKQQIANAAYALLNKTAAVTFDIEERKSGDRTYKNNVISAVVPAAEGAALTPTSNPGGGGAGGGNRGGGYRGKSAEEQSVINRSAALARSIEAHAAGLVKLENREQLFAFSDVLVSYIEGPKTAPTAQGGAVSSDGGGAVAGAEAPTSAPTAPAETAAPAATAPGPDDDIPF